MFIDEIRCSFGVLSVVHPGSYFVCGGTRYCLCPFSFGHAGFCELSAIAIARSYR